MIVDATDASFDRDVLEADVPVLVDFTAPWCRPCRAIEPILDELEREHEGRLQLVQLDIDANLGVPSRYGVLSLPTVILFVGGEPVETILGAQPRRRYAEAVARSSATSRAVAEQRDSLDDTRRRGRPAPRMPCSRPREVAYRGTQPAREARSEPLPAELAPAVAERARRRAA